MHMPGQPRQSLGDPAAYWEVSYASTRILSEAPSVSAAVNAILALLLRFDPWVCATFWFVDELDVVLRCGAVLLRPEVDLARFQKVTESRTFSIGEGLPGRTWSQKQVVWIDDVRQESNFPRASVAKLDGVVTGCALPVVSGKMVYGVLEVFSDRAVARDASFVAFAEALGAQIGVFFARSRAEAAAAEADAQFRLIAEGASLAVFTIDEDSRVLFANSGVIRLFGYQPDEVIGRQLTMVMPDYLRHLHEHGLRRYIATGRRHVDWDGVPLPGLHKDGREIPLEISFREFWRAGKRVFTGFCRPRRRADDRKPKPHSDD